MPLCTFPPENTWSPALSASTSARFYGQIRNLRIDITRTNPGAYVAAQHYQVTQATTIENVEVIADSGTVRFSCLIGHQIPELTLNSQTQQSIYAENGSWGVMSDIAFTGGNFGTCKSTFNL